MDSIISNCEKYDVTIFGGGPAGISCAYTSAKLGLKTLLIEKGNSLGGQITGALVVPMMQSDTEDINTDFYKKLIEYAKKIGAQITYSDGNDGWFNPVLLKIVFERMLKDAGADILFEAELKDFEIELSKENQNEDFVKSVTIQTVFSSKTLSIPIYSKYYVDATGNSNFCKFLNCNFIDDNEKFQPDSLRFIVSNINLEKFAKQILDLDKDRSVTTATRLDKAVHLSTAYTFDTNKVWGLSGLFEEAISAGDLKPYDAAYFQVFTIANMPNSLAFNCPRLHECSSNKPFSHSNALIEARECILRLHGFVKKYFNGFEDSFISQIADMTGARVSMRPKTRYIYKLDDLISGKTFETPVLAGNYPVDIHSNNKNTSVLQTVKKYYLPVECLICNDWGNVFVAGRNLGAEFEAQAALRIQKSCLSMGEGLAKYLKNKTKL